MIQFVSIMDEIGLGNIITILAGHKLRNSSLFVFLILIQFVIIMDEHHLGGPQNCNMV